MRKAVFLDRDGVLNKCPAENGKPYPPRDAQSMEFFPDAAPALQRLRKEGFLLVCCTNQPDVARGARTIENVEAMNAKTLAELPLDGLYVCLHDNVDNCCCRKPKPGMLLQAAADLNIELGSSFMIGDRAGDIGAGAAAGCRTIFIERGWREPKPDADFSCATLEEAVDWILAGIYNKKS